MKIVTPIELSTQADACARAIPCSVCEGASLSILLTPADVETERRWLAKFRRQRARRADTSADTATNADKEQVAYTQTEATFIVRCTNCGTVLRDPQPTCETLRALYASDTYGKATLDQLAANQDDFFRRKARWVQTYLPPAAAIIEVGSFVGSFLRASGEMGWQAMGVDIGEETVAYTRDAGCRVIQGDICQIELAAAAWDGIFIWNTFDQLCNPGQVLDCAFSLLKEGGLLVLRIPNGDFETGCLQLRRQWHGTRRAYRVMCVQAYNSFLSFPYLTGYTAASIGKLLHWHGFDTEAIQGDTIVRLADESTLPFAIREEECYKRAARRFCRRFEAKTGRLSYPWLDVVARKRANT
jgi:SAM-dependent methyltransferase